MAGDTSRANGRRSRGPRSAAGKARSCCNALRHGLAAQALRSAAPTQCTLELALELAEPYAADPAVLQAALDLAQAEEALAAVCRERQRVLQHEADKAARLVALCDGLTASLSLLPAPPPGTNEGEGDLAGQALMAAIAGASLQRPDGTPALRAWVTGAPELQRLERYHRRAFGRRERAVAALRRALEEADRGGAGPADPGLLARLAQTLASQRADTARPSGPRASSTGRARP